jgi:hypothetical protein
MSITGIRDGKFTEPCVEVSKMRDDGKFHRWCYKHHHWLNDVPPQRTVSDVLREDSDRARAAVASKEPL